MQIYQNSRRNFLSSMAILSAAAAFTPAFQKLPLPTNSNDDLQNKWNSFCQKSGCEKLNSFDDLVNQFELDAMPGHFYKKGEVVCFPRENIIARPTWIYWQNHPSKPAGVLIDLIEKNSFKKVACLNRFEVDALYKVSKEFYKDNLLEAYCNNLLAMPNGDMPFLKNKLLVCENSLIQKISYYKNRELLFQKKFIYYS
jgi:hypothetical protein